MTTLHQTQYGINILDTPYQAVKKYGEKQSSAQCIDVAYDGDTFVQVGITQYLSATLVSEKFEYSLQTATNFDFQAVIYAKNKFVAVGKTGTIATSSKELKSNKELPWIKKPVSGLTADLFEVVYGDGKFVAVGDKGTILTSTDGASWSKVSASAVTGKLTGITYGGSKFVAVSEVGKIFTSPHGSNWANKYSGAGFEFMGVAAKP
jgi:photosystem II stability/assembly factor-like uncharacterized protein